MQPKKPVAYGRCPADMAGTDNIAINNLVIFFIFLYHLKNLQVQFITKLTTLQHKKDINLL